MTVRKLFVNLPVADLEKSVAFFTTLGFTFDERFTDETATCMLIGEDAYAMLLTRSKFEEFATKQIADARTQTEALFAITADTREGVDELADKALAAGATPAKDPSDMGFMYGRSFNDLDGHHWEVFWMDPVAVERGPDAVATSAG